jgi:hypothetical protein
MFVSSYLRMVDRRGVFGKKATRATVRASRGQGGVERARRDRDASAER